MAVKEREERMKREKREEGCRAGGAGRCLADLSSSGQQQAASVRHVAARWLGGWAGGTLTPPPPAALHESGEIGRGLW